MIPLFDYGSINEDHKAAAEECAKVLDDNGLAHFAAVIRERFKIVEPKRLPVEDSEFYRVAKAFGIPPAAQGYMVGPDGVQIPMVAVCAPITQLDSFLEHYKNLLCKE